MTTLRQALLLVGSARRPRSTSEALGTYLLERLAEKGFETETLLLHRALKSEEKREALLEATDRADVLVVAFPLYVDSLPEEAVEAMSRSIIPSWAYRWMGWFGWRQQARKHGVQRQLYARPYES